MRTIGIRELKARMSEVIREVQKGETIEVTNHGEVVAFLVPAHRPTDDSEQRAALVSLGALRAQIATHVSEPTDVTQVISDMRR